MSKLLKLKCFQNQKRISQICPVLAHRFSIKFCRSFWLCSFYLRPSLSNLPEHPKGEQEVIRRFVLMHLPGKITYREIDEMIATVDKNEDWKISYSEFRVSFCCLPPENDFLKEIFRYQCYLLTIFIFAISIVINLITLTDAIQTWKMSNVLTVINLPTIYLRNAWTWLQFCRLYLFVQINWKTVTMPATRWRWVPFPLIIQTQN